jgi:hypothetical protein
MASVNYRKAFWRVLWCVGVALLLLIPPMTATVSREPFAQWRRIVEETSLASWLGILIVTSVLLGIIALWRSHTAQVSVATPVPATPLLLSIEKAVTREQGGNGLASRPEWVNFKWVVIGWIIVPTPMLECVVADGRWVIRHTRIYVTPLRLVGRPMSLRRVLLKPTVREISNVVALSQDSWQVSLDIRLTYQVKNPRRVLTEDPLAELDSHVRGGIGEQLRAFSHAEIAADRGSLREAIETRLRGSRVLDGFSISDVNVVTIRSDERRLELVRQKELARGEKDLTELRGQNMLLQANYQRQINTWQQKTLDWLAQQNHARDVEKLRLQLENASNCSA